MKHYSAFAIAREALRGHRGWERAWRSPEPRRRYKVVVVGGGGHGLATAYYLGKNHGITDVAVLEKGWLGGGNTGRNTTIIRSNYLQDASVALYEKARSLYETLSQDLNYNVMFSPRGVLMLAQTHHEVRGYKRTAQANALQGIETEYVGPERVRELCPIIRVEGPRYPVLGALWQPRGGTARHDAVAWGYARACSGMGMDIVENCEVTGVRVSNGRVMGVETTRGRGGLRQARGLRGGPFGRAGGDGGVPAADRVGGAPGAGVGAGEALHGRRRDGQHGARLHEPVRQRRDGDRRRRRRLRQLLRSAAPSSTSRRRCAR